MADISTKAVSDKSEIIDSGEGKVESAKRDEIDLQKLADYIWGEYVDRQKNRTSREKIWKEVDRQIRMEPDISFKMADNGSIIADKKWMPEMELPLQAQTLEVLTADAKRLMLPANGRWFQAHGELNDDLLRKLESRGLIAGDSMETPSIINQDNVNKLVEGFLSNIHKQYDFGCSLDLVNAESFKYGMGVGRVRPVKRKMTVYTNTGPHIKDMIIPVFLPRSIKDTYIDDRKYSLMNEGYEIGRSVIHYSCQNLTDIIISANKGSKDPNDMNGGWMPGNIKGLEDEKRKGVSVLEWEGDIVCPMKGNKSLYIPSVVITVANGSKSNGESCRSVIRMRFLKGVSASYVLFPYHYESISDPYATSPLMKGAPIQKAATEAFNRLMQASILNTEPPIIYEKSEPGLAATNGPRIFPGCRIGVIGGIDGVKKLDIGDPNSLFAVYTGLLRQYADVTGINAPRLGEQTVSHTTAFAKQAELNRGTVRTVDYADSMLSSPLERVLGLEYDIIKEHMSGDKQSVFLEPYNGYVSISKDDLPERVQFRVFGGGGEAQESVKNQKRQNAIMLAVQVDAIKVQNGLGQPMNYQEIQKYILKEGGLNDTEQFFTPAPSGASQGAEAGQPVPGTPGASPGGAISTALQTIAFGQRGE